ncbi:hypothetical protein HNQ50_004446 [Silvimonas terrae]|uniref:Uncharacterized protein n=1 Tax=Silvimonas terrae TaxID=300266 RepID=A0A840RN38_9NEIS|nr:hypothetical protein [Silvimonas terrae]MBB5193686.1 hypothetical protein [Silvimonas terrae]
MVAAWADGPEFDCDAYEQNLKAAVAPWPKTFCSGRFLFLHIGDVFTRGHPGTGARVCLFLEPLFRDFFIVHHCRRTQGFGTPGVFVFIAAAMLVVMLVIGLMGPKTNGLALEQISTEL